MIKVVGISFFFLIGGFFVFRGMTQGDSGAVFIGGTTVVMAVLLLLGATVFRKSIDTEENARVGMKVIKAALTEEVDLDK